MKILVRLVLLVITAVAVNAQNPVERQIYCVDAGSTDAYSCTPASVIGSYTTGRQFYTFIANTGNTGAATINFGPGVKTIKKVVGGITTDLDTNDIRAGQIVILKYDGTNMQMASQLGNSGGGGSVTSVSWTGGIVSIATPTTTPAFTIAGTSGGIPYFNSATTWATSGALTANLPVIGGGAGVAPSVGTRSGNTTAFVTTTGAQTSGRCVEIDASGNHIAAAAGCAAGAGTVTSVDATGGLQTASGSPITATGTVRGAYVVNAQIGTTYTVLTGDRGKTVTFSNVGAVAVTQPQAGAGFENGWFYFAKNIGAGTATITPTTSTISGAASLALATGDECQITSDGTNYEAICDSGILTQGAGTALVKARTGVTVTVDSAQVGFLGTANNWAAKQSYVKTGNIAAFKLTPSIAPTITLTAGDFYFDSTLNAPEWYDGAAWVVAAKDTTTTRGDLIVRGASGLTRLAVGGAGTFKYSDGTDVVNRIPLITDLSAFTYASFAGQLTTFPFAKNAQTTTYTVVAGDFDACKTITTASASFTITLLAVAPSDGKCIRILNYGAGTITVARNGLTINGAAVDQTIAAGSASAPTGLLITSDGTNYFAQALGAGGGGANTALSNLAGVAINTSLISDTTNTDNLGSVSIYWNQGFISQISTGVGGINYGCSFINEICWSSAAFQSWGGDVGLARPAAGILNINDGQGAGSTTYRDLRLRKQQFTTDTEPTCNATNRGYVVLVAGGAGVADTFRVCTKDAADAYAYRALF